MCLRAAMRRPLRSKRAITSPVSPRANASGFTRISVLSKGVLPFGVVGGPGAYAPGGREEAVAPSSPPSGSRRREGGGGSARLDAADARRPLRLTGSVVAAVVGAPAISDSQYGQIFHSGSSGLPHVWHGSLSRRRQLGQRRKESSTRKPQ